MAQNSHSSGRTVKFGLHQHPGERQSSAEGVEVRWTRALESRPKDYLTAPVDLEYHITLQEYAHEGGRPKESGKE